MAKIAFGWEINDEDYSRTMAALRASTKIAEDATDEATMQQFAQRFAAAIALVVLDYERDESLKSMPPPQPPIKIEAVESEEAAEVSRRV